MSTDAMADSGQQAAWKHFLAFLLLPLPLAAADLVTFSTGAQMTALRAECPAGSSRCVLHLEGGRVEVPASAIAGVERLPEPERASQPQPAEPHPPARPAKDPRQLVTEAALRHGLPPELVHAVAWAESGYRPDAVSPKGALGIMQLMPSTAALLGADPRDPEQNADAGVRFLRELLLRYQGKPNPVRRALAAYNAGPRAVERYGGLPPYRETLNYVERVIERYWRLVRGAQSTAPAP
ncbi:MAG: lytic transglycosylase domain-containing protein [Bryobacteraceae bacterium]|nr:lytic transglycosylase domain-containing protein [Bryobacteraceae bacterium]